MKQKRRLSVAVILAGLLCLLSLIVMMAALLRSPEKVPFNPPPFDPSACAGIPEVSEELGWGSVDVKAYRFFICGTIRAQADAAEVWLYNPAENTVWLKLRILDDDENILGQTGLIRPGEYVQSVSLNGEIDDTQPIVLKIMAYQPETYYSEGAVSLNTAMMRGG